MRHRFLAIGILWCPSLLHAQTLAVQPTSSYSSPLLKLEETEPRLSLPTRRPIAGTRGPSRSRDTWASEPHSGSLKRRSITRRLVGLGGLGVGAGAAACVLGERRSRGRRAPRRRLYNPRLH